MLQYVCNQKLYTIMQVHKMGITIENCLYYDSIELKLYTIIQGYKIGGTICSTTIICPKCL